MKYKQIIVGEYVFTPCENAFNNKVSYWISKDGYSIAVYAFTVYDGNVKTMLNDETIPSYISHFESKVKNSCISVEEAKEKAIQICGLIEDLLVEHNLTIDTEERREYMEDMDEDEKDEVARLFGEVYYSMEDRIREIIKNN